jgi:hypothetical protein
MHRYKKWRTINWKQIGVKVKLIACSKKGKYPFIVLCSLLHFELQEECEKKAFPSLSSSQHFYRLLEGRKMDHSISYAIISTELRPEE